MHEPAGHGQRATRREWLGLAVLALPTLLLSLDVSILYLALPHVTADLEADSTQQLWILDIYSFMLAGFLVTMGTLGDRVGRRRLLLIGAAAFGVASLIAAFSTSAEMLIAARAFLGIAGATLMPSTMALLRNMFRDSGQLGLAIGIWFACFMAGLALGPLVGGVLLEQFWWGAAFLFGVPIMAVLLVAGPLLLPEFRSLDAGRVDLVSVGLSLATILPIIHGLKQLARDGLSLPTVLAIAIGAVLGAVFVRRQGRLANPLVDLRLFTSRSFSTVLSVMLLGGVVMAGVSLVATMYLQIVQGLKPLEAGLWLLPQNFAMVGGSLVAPILARRIPAVYVITIGLAIAASGALILGQVDSAGGVGTLVLGLVLASGGIALPLPLATNLMLQSSPAEKAGSVASLSETSSQFGIAVGVATLGTLAALVYRAQLGAASPAGIPADALEVARESLIAAVIAAQSLPREAQSALIEEAHSAFTAGLNVVGLVGALVFIALALVSVVSLRRTVA